MKCSIEILYHLSCDQCSKWFSIADLKVSIGQELICPHCGHKSTIDAMINGNQETVEGVAWVFTDTGE